MVLLVGLEDDVLGLRVALQRRVEDLLLDHLVDGELALDRREQLLARLHAALGGRLQLREQPLHLVVVRLEHRDRVHRPFPCWRWEEERRPVGRPSGQRAGNGTGQVPSAITLDVEPAPSSGRDLVGLVRSPAALLSSALRRDTALGRPPRIL